MWYVFISTWIAVNLEVWSTPVLEGSIEVTSMQSSEEHIAIVHNSFCYFEKETICLAIVILVMSNFRRTPPQLKAETHRGRETVTRRDFPVFKSE